MLTDGARRVRGETGQLQVRDFVELVADALADD
jgi:hypothetical protein